MSNPCLLLNEAGVRRYLRQGGNPNAYVSFPWLICHSPCDFYSRCGLLGVFCTPLGYFMGIMFAITMPCVICDQTHVLSLAIREGRLADGHNGAGKLLIEHGADPSMAGRKGLCNTHEPIKDTHDYPSSLVSVVKGSALKMQVSVMTRNIEGGGNVWQDRIRQYRSMMALIGVSLSDEAIIGMFQDFTFVEVYERVAKDSRYLVPAQWTLDIQQRNEIGHLSRLFVQGTGVSSSYTSDLNHGLARGAAEEVGRHAMREGLNQASGQCNIM